MNRAELRRQKKKSEKTAIYQFTKEQLDNEIQKGFDKYAKEIREEVIEDYKEKLFSLVVGLSALVLHEDFGFGPVRMERYVKHLMENIDCLGENKFNAKDVEKTIMSETGLCLSGEAMYILSRKERREMLDERKGLLEKS